MASGGSPKRGSGRKIVKGPLFGSGGGQKHLSRGEYCLFFTRTTFRKGPRPLGPMVQAPLGKHTIVGRLSHIAALVNVSSLLHVHWVVLLESSFFSESSVCGLKSVGSECMNADHNLDWSDDHKEFQTCTFSCPNLPSGPQFLRIKHANEIKANSFFAAENNLGVEAHFAMLFVKKLKGCVSWTLQRCAITRTKQTNTHRTKRRKKKDKAVDFSDDRRFVQLSVPSQAVGPDTAPWGVDRVVLVAPAHTEIRPVARETRFARTTRFLLLCWECNYVESDRRRCENEPDCRGQPTDFHAPTGLCAHPPRIPAGVWPA